MFTFKKIKFSKFYHVSDQTRFLCVILRILSESRVFLKVSKSEIDLWGIPHWGIQCFRRLVSSNKVVYCYIHNYSRCNIWLLSSVEPRVVTIEIIIDYNVLLLIFPSPHKFIFLFLILIWCPCFHLYRVNIFHFRLDALVYGSMPL